MIRKLSVPGKRTAPGDQDAMGEQAGHERVQRSPSGINDSFEALKKSGPGAASQLRPYSQLVTYPVR